MPAETAPDAKSCAPSLRRSERRPRSLSSKGSRRVASSSRAARRAAWSPSARRGPALLSAQAVVIATGGIGGLYRDSTNPLGSFGQGLALAARAGAELADLEFVQFHPTALDVSVRPTPLVSEAVRGDGAILVDETGRRFMADVPGAELAPRDVVARAIAAERERGRRTFLDARAAIGARFPERFPVIAAACRTAGVDPTREPIPVRPAQHYHMGGIAVDAEGRSSIAGLWACGEAACTGLHGANRLASNSLTEAAVFGVIVARSIEAAPLRAPARLQRAPAPVAADPTAVRPLLTPAAGVTRDGATLAAAIGPLAALAASRLAGRRSRRCRADDRGRRAEARAQRWRPQPHRLSRTAVGAPSLALSLSPTPSPRPQRLRREPISGEPDMPLVPLPHLLIEPLVRQALLEDLGRAGDVTTDAIAPADQKVRCVMDARQAGVVAGLDLAALAFRLIDPAIRCSRHSPTAAP